MTSDPPNTIACEFKNFKNINISVNLVESFATKLNDIGVKLGYMVTSKGFQKGAIKTAKFYNIKLFKLREMDRKKAIKIFPHFNFEGLAESPLWILDQEGKVLLVGSGTLTEKSRDK